MASSRCCLRWWRRLVSSSSGFVLCVLATVLLVVRFGCFTSALVYAVSTPVVVRCLHTCFALGCTRLLVADLMVDCGRQQVYGSRQRQCFLSFASHFSSGSYEFSLGLPGFNQQS